MGSERPDEGTCSHDCTYTTDEIAHKNTTKKFFIRVRGKWEAGSERWEVGNGKWEAGIGIGNWNWKAGNWGTGNGKWEVGSGKWNWELESGIGK